MNRGRRKRRDRPGETEGRCVGPIRLTWSGTYYWIADGPVPLAVAHELYQHPLGRRAARVNGNCNRPPPEGNEVHWYTADGARVLPLRDEKPIRRVTQWLAEVWLEFELTRAPRWIAAVPDHSQPAARHDHPSKIGPIVYHDHPSELGATPYIELYHLDGDEALVLFECTLRKHEVDKTSRPTWWRGRFPAARAKRVP